MQNVRFLLLFLLATGLIASCADDTSSNNAESVSPDAETIWALVPFQKVDSVNPILTPGNGEFVCPVRNEKIK